MQTTRRGFLQGMAAMGGTAGLLTPVAARAALDPSSRVGSFKILEVFLQQGVSHADALWLSDGFGGSWPGAVLNDGIYPGSTGPGPTFLVGTDAAGHQVRMGPCAEPLDGTALFDRLRLVAMHHTLQPHGPATALGLTGFALGAPDFAGLGARVQAMYGAAVPRASVVVDVNAMSPTLVAYALATGRLGPAAQPFLVPFHDPGFVAGLAARDLYAPTDPLVAFYRNRMARRLTHGAEGRVRSHHFDLYSDNLDKVQGGGDVAGLLTPFEADFGGTDDSYVANRLTAAIPLAAALLGGDTRHVCMLADRGLHPFDMHDPRPGDGGVFTFDQHTTRVNGNLWGLFDALRTAVDAGLLDLDETLVVVHTEFGRKGPETDGDGTAHHPRGYASVLIGGPIPASGPSLAGGIAYDTDAHGRGIDAFGPGSGTAFGPADLMAGLTLAAGIAPIQDLAFAEADTSVDTSLSSVEDALATHLFGL